MHIDPLGTDLLRMSISGVLAKDHRVGTTEERSYVVRKQLANCPDVFELRPTLVLVSL